MNDYQTLMEETEVVEVVYRAIKVLSDGTIIVYYSCDDYIVEVIFTKEVEGYSLNWQFVESVKDGVTPLPKWDARDFDEFIEKGDEWFGDNVFSVLSYQKIILTDEVLNLIGKVQA